MIPLSAGWLVLKQQDLDGEAYCDSWPASQSASRSAGTDQTRFPDPRHMHGLWNQLENGALVL